MFYETPCHHQGHSGSKVQGQDVNGQRIQGICILVIKTVPCIGQSLQKTLKLAGWRTVIQTYGRTVGRTHRHIDSGWTDGRIDTWSDGWTYGRIDI